METNKIDVSSQGNAILNLSGSGSLEGLSLKGSIAPDKAEAMKTVCTSFTHTKYQHYSTKMSQCPCHHT